MDRRQPPRPLLQPQDAFAALAQITLRDNSLDSVMEQIAALTKQTVPGADEVSVTVVDGEAATTVSFTGPLALHLDERQYERGYGPCLDCIAGGEVVHIQSMTGDRRWPEWTVAARQHGAGSSLSIPVPVQREVSAALNIYSTREHSFGAEAMQLASTFAAHAGVVLANMHLYEAQARVAEQMQVAMKSRAVIEQAKGVLVARHRCSVPEAFDMLVLQAQEARRELREVAADVVREAEPRPAAAESRQRDRL